MLEVWQRSVLERVRLDKRTGHTYKRVGREARCLKTTRDHEDFVDHMHGEAASRAGVERRVSGGHVDQALRVLARATSS